MSGSGPDDEDRTGLDFERAELEGEASRGTCSSCGVPLAGAYFTAGGSVLCERCRYALQEAHESGGGLRRFTRAAVYGLVAGSAGALLWGVVTEVTGYEIGLVAIAVGWVVGSSIKAATSGRGGVAYQLMAVGITYLAIVSTYIPTILETMDAEPTASSEARADGDGSARSTPSDSPPGDVGALEGPALYLAALIVAMMVPVWGGLENLIGILIIGFALWQAWVINRRTEIAFEGPFELGSAGPAS